MGDWLTRTPTGEIAIVPRGFPQVGIPRVILEDMAKAEVEAMAAGLIAQGEALRRWNDQRPDPTPMPGFFDGVPFPKPEQYDWNVKTRR